MSRSLIIVCYLKRIAHSRTKKKNNQQHNDYRNGAATSARLDSALAHDSVVAIDDQRWRDERDYIERYHARRRATANQAYDRVVVVQRQRDVAPAAKRLDRADETVFVVFVFWRKKNFL